MVIEYERNIIMEKVKVVIGDRLGKGKNVAAGIEEAGGIAILIKGVGADMKVGDFMHDNNADFGISFCGSGGAGAITAKSKYGYSAEYGLRSIDAGVTAIKNGTQVIGFGFMDSKELGKRLTEAFLQKSK